MNAVEFERAAKSIVPPIGASRAICVVDHEPGERLPNGSPSGKGGRTTYQAAFLVHGRIRSDPVGPAFPRPRDAFRLVDLLNGEAPRPAEEGLSGREKPVSRAFPRQPEVPDGTQDASSTPGTCVVCKGPLPPGFRRQRRTCSGACRVARARGRGAPETHGADADGGSRSAVTVSRPPEAISLGARVLPSPAGPPTGSLSLDL